MGFIGKNLLEILIQKYKIIGININQDKKRRNYIPIKHNVSKIFPTSIPYKLAGVIHLAAITDVNFCNNNPQKCISVNVNGTQRMLEIARKNNCKFVYVSTSHIYGPAKQLPMREDHPKNPTSIYAASKLAGEIICESYAKSYGMDVSIVRLFSVYGPYSPPHLVISKIISQINTNSLVLGNLYPRRDFIYVSDVINAIELIQRKTNGFNVYNVGTGKSKSILEVCNIVMKKTHKQLPILNDKSITRKLDVNEIVSNSSKLKKLGWKSKIPFEKGIELTINWNNSKQK